MFNLFTNGDAFEQKAYNLFLEEKFPSYEIFWKKFIVELTNRPADVHTKTDVELKKLFPTESLEKIHERIVILQLHYSAFRMLFKAYEYIQKADKDLGAVESIFSGLYSTLDISAEMFGRYEKIKNNLPVTVDPFDPKISVQNSFKIRKKWQRENVYPKHIQDIRNYRNLMLHGQMFGSMATAAAGLLILPKPSEIEKYLDWRSIGASFHSPQVNSLDDFQHTRNIAEPAFDAVIEFLEDEWRRNII